MFQALAQLPILPNQAAKLDTELVRRSIFGTAAIEGNPLSEKRVDELLAEPPAMGVCGYKIGSGECNNFPLVDHIAGFGKPVILSTGMNPMESIAKSVDILRARKVPFGLMHTTSMYPTPPEKVRLGAMQQLMSAFPDAVVGLSDHTLTIHTCLGAAALGASMPSSWCTVVFGTATPAVAWPRLLRRTSLAVQVCAKHRT